MRLPRRCRHATLLACALLAAPLAVAERADRGKPVELDAAHFTVDDKAKTRTFAGDVRLVQGTLQLRAERIVVIDDIEGFQRGVAYGKAGTQAWFRQKREGRDEFVEGQADRIEYDGHTERVEFFGNATVKNAQDIVTGPYIRYDARTENYEVSGGGASPTPGTGGRVRAVIQPRNADPAPAKPGPPATNP